MKKGVHIKLSFLIASFLIIAFVFGSFQYSGVGRVEAADTVKISECKINDMSDICLMGDVILIVDKDVKFNNLRVDGSLTIKGPVKLKTQGIYVFGDLTIASGADIEISGEYGGLFVDGNMTLQESSKLSFSTQIDIGNDNPDPFNVTRNINIAGDFNYVSPGYGILAVDPDKDVDCDINITGGNVNIKCVKTALYATSNINISGGKVVINCSKNAMYADIVNFFGGYIESNCSDTSDKMMNITGYKGRGMDSNMQIIAPENGQFKSVTKTFDGYPYTFYAVVDKNDNIPNKVIVKEKEKPSSSTGASTGSGTGTGNAKPTPQYKNEWVNGKWYGADGKCTYSGTLSWKCNDTGWWVEDTEGWYPTSQWQKIDGKWYYFLDSGYMDYSEYRDGCWLGSDGAWVEQYSGGHWCSDGNGWWYEDSSGWYPANQYLWIDGVNYWFKADGYMS